MSKENWRTQLGKIEVKFDAITVSCQTPFHKTSYIIGVNAYFKHTLAAATNHFRNSSDGSTRGLNAHDSGTVGQNLAFKLGTQKPGKLPSPNSGKYTPTQKRHPKVTLHILQSLDPRIQGRQIVANGDWNKLKDLFKSTNIIQKKTATLKLVSLRHNPPPPHPVFTTNPLPLPHPPGSTTINFPHLELHWPFRCTLGCWTGCFCYCHLSSFFFKPKNRKRLPQKPRKLRCVSISCGLFQNE